MLCIISETNEIYFWKIYIGSALKLTLVVDCYFCKSMFWLVLLGVEIMEFFLYFFTELNVNWWSFLEIKALSCMRNYIWQNSYSDCPNKSCCFDLLADIGILEHGIWNQFDEVFEGEPFRKSTRSLLGYLESSNGKPCWLWA